MQTRQDDVAEKTAKPTINALLSNAVDTDCEEEFAQALREERKTLKISQIDLALACHYTKNTISRWETDEQIDPHNPDGPKIYLPVAERFLPFDADTVSTIIDGLIEFYALTVDEEDQAKISRRREELETRLQAAFWCDSAVQFLAKKGTKGQE